MGDTILRASAVLVALIAATAPSNAEPATASARAGEFAQQIAASYGTAHGLPSADVLAVHVDGRGRVWVGTRGGLALFDGASLAARHVFQQSADARSPGRFTTVSMPATGGVEPPATTSPGPPVTAIASSGAWLLVATGGASAIADEEVAAVDATGEVAAQVWLLELSRTAAAARPRRTAALDVSGPVRDLAVASSPAIAKSRGRSNESDAEAAAAAPRREILIATRAGVLVVEAVLGEARALDGATSREREGGQGLAGRGERLATSAPRLVLDVDARRVAAAPPGCPVAVAAAEGLYVRECPDADASGPAEWSRLLPRDGAQSWAPVDVRAVAFAPDDALWFASPQGLGRRDADGRFVLLDGRDGLPVSDVVAAAADASGVWLGTRVGAVRHAPLSRGAPARAVRGEALWEYRQGRRWLPADDVRDVAVAADGTVWLATSAGVGRIATVPMTLAEKARLFEDEIDRYHRRTSYGYVDAVRLAAPGDRSRFERRSSDNDGLWTGMYGAAACYAYAAARDDGERARAKERATAAFRALAFLSEVTQGGTHAAPRGFIARSILPVGGPDPNAGRVEEDRRRRAEEDRLWKLIAPRWPTDASGRWYWKTDASSDELDGHFFFYALYHDLVAESDAERAEVRAFVARIADHLLAHDYALHDHDGEPTRWAVFGPRRLNHDPMWWVERGLNSLSILSYLRVAAHVVGDARYDRAARALIEEHGYAANVRVPKIHSGPGTGNQSDDEMAFMSFRNLIAYERDPALRAIWAHAFYRYWEMERRERNPLFAFLYAATVRGLPAHRDAFDLVELELDPRDVALRDAVETLERFPLDRVDWALRNSHREDVVPLDEGEREDGGAPGGAERRAVDGIRAASARPARGFRRDRKVLPIDERFVDHWNHDPWRLDQGGDGRTLADGASFLLPYYLGLHEGFLAE